MCYYYDLTPHLAGGIDAGLISNCKLTVNTKFSAALMNTYNIIIFSESDDQISIDGQGVGCLGAVLLCYKSFGSVNFFCGDDLRSVFAIDQFLKLSRLGCRRYICNTDPSSLSSEH